MPILGQGMRQIGWKFAKLAARQVGDHQRVFGSADPHERRTVLPDGFSPLLLYLTLPRFVTNSGEVFLCFQAFEIERCPSHWQPRLA